MPKNTLKDGQIVRVLDARPDRVDFRDREFQPSLISLPGEYPSQGIIETYFPLYSKNLILDQGSEGACTGFGLAATINYLLFVHYLQQYEYENENEDDEYDVDLLEETLSDDQKVSPRMLYQLARIYDEWPGEDYEGSSCRGAMKGWHRHGVCTESYWPYRKGGRVQFVSPEEGWQQDAASRPLGAYYRVNKDSILEMQSAIHEVGAIYVSAKVHEGWSLRKSKDLPVISIHEEITGGHAFALVGYNSQGFIVQNSWGEDWGYCGFALLTYQDWIQHGTDAWVAVLGAAIEIQEVSRSYSSLRLEEVDSGRANWFWQSDQSVGAIRYRNKDVEPLSESEAYEHTVVLGNNGRPLNRFIDANNSEITLREAALINPSKWLTEKKKKKLVIYAHGGLNEEAASLKRIRVMAPYYIQNGIYPLFITWKTGFLESISGMLGDVISKFFTGEEIPEAGWLEDWKKRIQEARDRTIEVACEQVLIKSVWTQMKQNAEAASKSGSGLYMLANSLSQLKKEVNGLEIHFVAHSAGSILLGYLLELMKRKKLSVKTCSLYAPACNLEFALRYYGRAHKNKVLSKNSLFVDIMNDERERADTVGPYGKSLLYLVSRALEDAHKTPLMGMETVWKPKAELPDMWNQDSLNSVKKWREFVKGTNGLDVHKQEMVSDGRGEIPLAHGSFDNDIKVMEKTLRRILGKKAPVKVESLRGF